MSILPRNTFPPFLALLVCLVLAGCAQQGGLGTPPEGKPLGAVVVLPVLAGDGEAGRQDASLSRGVTVLEGLFAEYFSNTPGITLLSREGYQALSGDLLGSPAALARRIGQEMKAEGVLSARMLRFRERQGTERGLSGHPASVAFELKLIDTADGGTLCTGSFDETQEAVLDNLFSFGKARERGFRWISASELAREGLFDKLENCPFLPQVKSGDAGK